MFEFHWALLIGLIKEKRRDIPCFYPFLLRLPPVPGV